MKIKLLLCSLLLAALPVFADISKVGDTAPSFAGKDQNGADFKLADLTGKKVVLLYFYPKDFTGGCTKEACSFRDGFEDFATNNVEIVGVSFDSADSHLQFIAKYKLNFTLLADPDGKIAHIFPVRVFMLQIYNLLDASGKIKDADLLKRLHAQAEGFTGFVENLKGVKLRGAKKLSRPSLFHTFRMEQSAMCL